MTVNKTQQAISALKFKVYDPVNNLKGMTDSLSLAAVMVDELENQSVIKKGRDVLWTNGNEYDGEGSVTLASTDMTHTKAVIKARLLELAVEGI